MFLCCTFSVALGTNWRGSRGPLRGWKPGPGMCDCHQLYSQSLPTWVFLVEPHMARVVAICSADPFAVETPGAMHSPTRGPISTACLLLAPAFHHNHPSSAVTGAQTSAVPDAVLSSSRVPSVCFPILPCTLHLPK